jgi:RNA polymerase sigma-70 factor, ECF subfamily
MGSVSRHVEPRFARRRERMLETERLPDHADRLYRAAYALCGTSHDAEDLVQGTFERVLRRPRFIRREGDLAYLLRALRVREGTIMSRLFRARERVAAQLEGVAA